MSKHLFVFFIEFIAVVPAILAQTFDSDFRLEKKLFPDDKILPSEFTVKKSTHHKDSEIFTINLRERETHHSSSIGGIKKQSQILITTKKNNSAILLLSSDSEYTNKTGVIFLHFIDFIFVDVLDGIIIVELKYGRLFIFRIPINHILKDMKGKNSSSIMPAFSYYVGKNNIPLKVTFNNSDNIISCLLTENEKTYKYDFMLNVDRHKINIKYVNNASCGKNDITKDRNIIKSSRPISLSQEEMERRKREFLASQPRKELFSENELKELFTEPDYTRITDPLQLAHAYDWFGKYPEALAALNSGTGISSSTVPWKAIAEKTYPNDEWWDSLSLKRGDVVAYYRLLGVGSGCLQHSSICLDSKKTWGANNQPSSSETWKWYECAPKEYYNAASFLAINHVKILRK